MNFPPENLDFLKDPTFEIDIKKLLLEKFYEERHQKHDLDLKKWELNKSSELERRRFWQNTPLVVALVGTITIAANMFSNYVLNNQSNANAENLASIQSQLDQIAKDADAGRESKREEREFAFKIIERELAKSNGTAARAEVLLFLVRAGILSSLNRDELEKMALVDLDKNPDAVGIPPTLGLSGLPNYNLAPVPDDTAQTKAAKALLTLAVNEINKNVAEETSTAHIAEYLSAVGIDNKGDSVSEIPWSATFLSWLLLKSGNERALNLSPSGITIWNSAVVRKMTFLLGEKPMLPGDIVFFTRGNQSPSMELVRNGTVQFTLTSSGVVYSVNGEIFQTIQGNVGNAIRLLDHNMSEESIIGIVRLADDQPTSTIEPK